MSERVLPEGWVLASIDQISCKGEQRKPEATEQFIYVDIGSIDRKSKVIASPQRLSGTDAPSRARKVIRAGDVLVSLTRPNLNAVALVGKEYDGQIASTGFEVIRPVGVDSRFVFFLVRDQAFIDAISGSVQGALYPAAKSTDVKSYQFPLPSFEEQKAIADKMDELLAQVNNLKVRLGSIPTILNKLRKSVLSAAVSGRLTEEWGRKKGLKLEWAQVEVGMLAKKEKHSLCIGPFGSSLKVKDYRSSGHPLVFVREIRARCFGDSTTKFIDGEKFAELSSHRARPGDLLITKMGDPPGDVAFYPVGRPEGVITADCIKLDVDKEVAAPEYVYYAMQSPIFRKRVVDASAGVAQKKVNLKNFKAIPFDLPGLEEQTEIVRRVGQLFAFADQIEQQVANAQARVDKLTQSILAKAFRGELTAEWRAENPELISGEKSAEALLERIKAEKARPQPAGRGHKRKSRQASLPV